MVGILKYKPEWVSYDTLQRLKKLEKKVGSLPILFALFFQHSISSFVMDVSNVFMSYGIPLTHWMVNLIAAMIIAYIYIRNITSVDLINKANDVKEKAGMESEKQTTFEDY